MFLQAVRRTSRRVCQCDFSVSAVVSYQCFCFSAAEIALSWISVVSRASFFRLYTARFAFYGHSDAFFSQILPRRQDKNIEISVLWHFRCFLFIESPKDTLKNHQKWHRLSFPMLFLPQISQEGSEKSSKMAHFFVFSDFFPRSQVVESLNSSNPNLQSQTPRQTPI